MSILRGWWPVGNVTVEKACFLIRYSHLTDWDVQNQCQTVSYIE